MQCDNVKLIAQVLVSFRHKRMGKGWIILWGSDATPRPKTLRQVPNADASSLRYVQPGSQLPTTASASISTRNSLPTSGA